YYDGSSGTVAIFSCLDDSLEHLLPPLARRYAAAGRARSGTMPRRCSFQLPCQSPVVCPPVLETQFGDLAPHDDVHQGADAHELAFTRWAPSTPSCCLRNGPPSMSANFVYAVETVTSLVFAPGPLWLTIKPTFAFL